MLFECGLFGPVVSLIKNAGPAILPPAFLPKHVRKNLEERARTIARQFGVPESKWSKWRAGYGLRRDLLMIADPAGEAARIKNIPR